MQLQRTWLLAACLATYLAAPAAAQEEGFVPLFNGKDFTGWRFSGGKQSGDAPPKNWCVEDGVIRLTGGGAPHLATQWEYDDFDMRFEWKPHKKGYNSGFYVRTGRNVGANQINLAQKAAGNLMGRKDGPAVPELQKPPGEWNEWRVLAVGDTLTFWCNGKQAWQVTNFKPARGYLGLQAEGAAIDFRNLRIKEIGYDRPAFQNARGWTTKNGRLTAARDVAPLETKDALGSYVLKLAYRADDPGKAHLLLRGDKGRLDLSDAAVRKAAHPAGQWNYLEVRADKGRAKVWLNGTTLPTSIDLGEGTGTLRVVPAGAALEVQGVRVKGEG